MRVDGSRLNTEVVLLKLAWQVLVEHVVGLSAGFLDGAVLIGFLHGWSCLSHSEEGCKWGKEGGSWGVQQ